MDILKLQQQANMMPTPALMQAMNDPKGQVPPYLALTILNERKKMKGAGAAGAAQQQLAQAPPTVAQGVAQGAMGIEGLPTGQAMPQQFAEGGIVAFAGGGMMPYDPQTLMPRGPNSPRPPMVGGLPPDTNPLDWLQDRWKYVTDYIQRQPGNLPQANYSNEGRPPTPVPEAPWDYEEPAARERPGFNRAAPSARAPDAGGIASLGLSDQRRQSHYGEFPKSPDFSNLPVGRMTPEEFNAYVAKEATRIAELFGPSAADKYVKEIQAERAGLTGRRQENTDEAWLRAGLAMMGGKSRFGVQNIAAGGLEGLNAYQVGKKALDNEERQLRAAEMQAALTAQQRSDLMKGRAMDQGTARNAEMRQDRTDDLALKNATYSAAADAAKFSLDSRKVDAMFAEVDTRRMEVRQRAQQAGNEKMLRVIDGAYKGAVDQVLAGLKGDPIAVEDFNKNPGKYADKIDRAFQQRMAATTEQLDGLKGRSTSAANFGLN